jgi:hypothetical protein
MDNPTKQACKCGRFPREFWKAVLDVRNQLRESAVEDFAKKCYPRGTGHMHELLNCIEDYLDIAREEGYFDGSD